MNGSDNADDYFEAVLAGTVRARVPNTIPRCIHCQFLSFDPKYPEARFAKCTHPSALSKDRTLSEILVGNDIKNHLEHFNYASVWRQTDAFLKERCGTKAKYFLEIVETPLMLEAKAAQSTSWLQRLNPFRKVKAGE